MQRPVAQSPAARKQAERERRREAGLTRVELWAYPEDVFALNRQALRMRAQRDKLRESLKQE